MNSIIAHFPGHGFPPPTGGGGSGGNVPEFKMGSAGMALTLLIGFTLIVYDRHKQRTNARKVVR